MRTLLILVVLGLAPAAWGQPAGGSWLDQSTPTSWNVAGAAVPKAPRPQDDDDPRCRQQARPPQLAEDRQVTQQGWQLVGAFQGGWNVVVVRAASAYDGMCRPFQFQAFVFVQGRFAGTLSPGLMDSRSDGALSQAFLYDGESLMAEYQRYAPADPLCCPSRTTSVRFAIDRTPASVRPVSASTSTPP